MPLFLNGGGILLALLLVLIASLALYGWAMRNAPYICELPDREGFPCGCRYKSRESYEEHLELCHDGGAR